MIISLLCCYWFKILLINSLVLSNKQFNFRIFFRWLLDFKGGGHVIQMLPLGYAPSSAFRGALILEPKTAVDRSWEKAVLKDRGSSCTYMGPLGEEELRTHCCEPELGWIPLSSGLVGGFWPEDDASEDYWWRALLDFTPRILRSQRVM